MDTLRILVLTLSFIAAVSTVTGHNITDILSDFPEYSVFNNYLTQTKLNDEINGRQTITVLVLNNNTVTEIIANQPLSVVKIALSIHVLLDFFDLNKLLTIGGGSVMSTTLYQTTGNAADGTGFVNITDLAGGKVGFGSSASGSKIDALYAKSVKQIPYNISVLEISSPIIAPGILTGTGTGTGTAPPPPARVNNISSLLDRAGCKTFARLITETGVLKVYETVAPKGITVFAPSDAAFKASGLPNLSTLSNAELVSLLLYHAIAGYVPKGSLKTAKNPITTLATTEIARYDFTVRSDGDSVTLNSGVDTSRVDITILDSVPLSVFRINSILLPTRLFAKPPSPATAPAPETSTPSAPDQPAPKPNASSPSPVSTTSPMLTPPAPSTPSPTGGPAPADSPTADDGNSNTSDACGSIKTSMIFLALVVISISGILSSMVA